MPYLVSTSFDIFFDNINLKGDHRETANSRKDRVVSLLEKDFEILDAFATGSIPKYTAVKGYADLDVMVVLHYSKHIQGKLPSTILENVRSSLSGYATRTRKNGQAVTLSYETWPDVDIVPVSRVSNSDGTVNYYNVPDMNREEWIKSRPRKHSTDMAEKNKVCGDNFKKIVKMIKWWNHQHSSYMESYHIEVIALKTFDSEINDVTWGIYSFFKKAVEEVTNYTFHEGDMVDDYLDYNDRQEVINRLKTAEEKSRNAWYLTYNGKTDDKKAIEIWKQIFGDKFPSYG